MKTRTIRPKQARIGMAVTKIRAHGTYRMRKHRGAWPTITACPYLPQGENGQPMVYVTLSDDPRGSFPLEMSDELIIAESQGG